jgi:tellurite resistance protein TerC
MILLDITFILITLNSMIIKTLKLAKRWIMIVFGFTLLILGILLAIPGVPGPGILVVWGGLAILAAEFLWARKLLKKFQYHGARLRNLIFHRNNPCRPEAEMQGNS